MANDAYNMFDIFYNNTDGDSFDKSSLTKEGFGNEHRRIAGRQSFI